MQFFALIGRLDLLDADTSFPRGQPGIVEIFPKFEILAMGFVIEVSMVHCRGSSSPCMVCTYLDGACAVDLSLGAPPLLLEVLGLYGVRGRLLGDAGALVPRVATLVHGVRLDDSLLVRGCC